MRKIVASLFTTVDGVVEAPEKWHFPYFNEEVGAIVVRDGERLFEQNGGALPLTLIESAALSNGVLHLVYGPVGSAPEGTYLQAAKAMADSGNEA